MRLDTILVGTDGSDTARAAMGFAAELAAAAGAELHAVHCMPDGDGTDADGVAAARALEIWTAPARQLGTAPVGSVRRGDPRVEITAHAEELGADLVVVGARGEGGFHGLTLGRVAEHLLHHAERPVAVVPAPGGPVAGGAIVVGVDGSDANRCAVEWAVGLARRTGARTEALFVHDPLADSYPHGTTTNWKYRGQAHAEELVAAVAGDDDDLAFHNRGGNAVEVLGDLAAETGAAMIVVGTRGHWTFGGRVLGHVPTQLSAHSPCPVVVVPH